ncbi:ubiquinone anaerobic biosynthesis accessory factor UbiT [Shewanella pealeana]|uniref:Ubiquinone biosynthesis accessory factor UbiT n=1 Tax=Shewanella pealeana (strain ATCC 700345 / ANG-SQ1) TaxID=398579 RepID=A8H6Z8_SHEPA|nr:SCP2 sterol-binding domain-containing protein [Shewanella pealeana]ABV88335.1 Sterol-binding domain protein [Shewanella pealeana ATCC 700345]
MQGFFPHKLAHKVLEIGPKVIAGPLAIVPFTLKAELLKRILGLLLAEQAADEELDFLDGRWVAIKIEDLGLTFEVTYTDTWQVRQLQEAEVTFTAQSKDLLLIAAAKEDPDTLFFQRKLCIEGDTELGLEVKNLLLSVEFDAMPAAIRVAIEKLAQALQALQAKAEPALV